MRYRSFLGALIASVLVGWPIFDTAADQPMPKRVEFKPTLSIGDKWKVAVAKWSEAPGLPEDKLVNWKPHLFTNVFYFSVEALVDVESESCYRVRVESKPRSGTTFMLNVSYWRIYLRQAGFTLKKVERLDDKTDRIQASRKFASGPIDATDWVSNVPLACPDFQEGPLDQESPVRRRKDGTAIGRPSDHCRQIEEIIRIRVEGKEMDALRVKLEKYQQDSSSRYTTETWIKGLPWWAEAIYYLNGTEWCSAKLLKE